MPSRMNRADCFRISWGVKKQVNAKFGKQGDYEDVAIVGERVVILKSNGSLFVFPLADVIYEEIDSVREWKGILPEGEYEGMYGDEATQSLYIICKNCADDNSKNFVSGYIYKVGDSVYQTGTFKIDVKEIKCLRRESKKGFPALGYCKESNHAGLVHHFRGQ